MYLRLVYVGCAPDIATFNYPVFETRTKESNTCTTKAPQYCPHPFFGDAIREYEVHLTRPFLSLFSPPRVSGASGGVLLYSISLFYCHGQPICCNVLACIALRVSYFYPSLCPSLSSLCHLLGRPKKKKQNTKKANQSETATNPLLFLPLSRCRWGGNDCVPFACNISCGYTNNNQS